MSEKAPKPRRVTVFRWLLLGLVLGIGVPVLIYFLLPPRYTGTARILFALEKPYIFFEDEKSDSDFKNFVDYQLAVMRSPLILDKVLASDEIAKCPGANGNGNPMDWLLENLKIEKDTGENVYRISFTSDTPEEARIISNLVLKHIITLYRDDLDSWRRELIDSLDQEVKRKAEVVKYSKNNTYAKLEQLQRDGKEGTYIPDVGNKPLPSDDSLVRLYEAKYKLEVLDSELKNLESVKKELEEGLRDVSSTEIDLRLRELHRANDPIAQMKNLKSEYEHELSELKAKDGALDVNGAARSKTLIERIETLEKLEPEGVQREAFLDMLRNDIKERRLKSLENIIEARKKEYEIQKKVTERLQKYFGAVDFSKEEERVRAREMINISFEHSQILRNEEILDRMQKRIDQLQTEAVPPMRIRVLHEATTPKFPDKNPIAPGKLIVLGILIFLAVQVLGVGANLRKIRFS